MKKVIRLTENDLHRIVKESVMRILSEGKVTNNKPIDDWADSQWCDENGCVKPECKDVLKKAYKKHYKREFSREKN